MLAGILREGDIGNDGEWDNWRLEGPAFVWYFRGSPHVHVWGERGRRSQRRHECLSGSRSSRRQHDFSPQRSRFVDRARLLPAVGLGRLCQRQPCADIRLQHSGGQPAIDVVGRLRCSSGEALNITNPCSVQPLT